jgi:hypothetical protein
MPASHPTLAGALSSASAWSSPSTGRSIVNAISAAHAGSSTLAVGR